MVRELYEGQFNDTNLLELANRGLVMWRVVPSHKRAAFMHEHFTGRVV
ncbi:MAG: hypothetical protein ACXVDN_10040 [Ktedonobacteraceae bacterium]